MNNTIVPHTSVPSWESIVGMRWCGAKIPISTPTIVMTSQMMKIFPLGPGEERLATRGGSLASISSYLVPQTTWTNPDMYPYAFMGPPKQATIDPHGNSQFQA